MARRNIVVSKYEKQSSAKLKSYKKDLYNEGKRLIFCAGLPSTGKTICAVKAGLEQVMGGKYSKVIIVRPVLIPECGLLKGTMLEKMAPYFRQAALYCEEVGQGSVDELIQYGKLEVLPADLLQGDRFRDAFVIFDEVQNIHKDKTFALLSRVGENSKFVIIGDRSRGQQGRKVRPGESLLDYAIEKFQGKDYVGIHEFYEKEDVLGDECTKDIILTLLDDFV